MELIRIDGFFSSDYLKLVVTKVVVALIILVKNGIIQKVRTLENGFVRF